MTNSRQHELFNELVGWVCEHVSNDEELYHTLHNVLGFTDSEIEESDIDYLSWYFEGKPDKCILFSKVTLTADNDSMDTFLCPGFPDCEEQIANTDGYMNFLEDNPDTESVVVEVERIPTEKAKAGMQTMMKSQCLKNAARVFSTPTPLIILDTTASSFRLTMRFFQWRKWYERDVFKGDADR